jgi:hypothetical protein
MRRTISFVIAILLTLTGFTSLAYLQLFAAGWKGWMVLAAGTVFAVGAMWLYSDFIDMSERKN